MVGSLCLKITDLKHKECRARSTELRRNARLAPQKAQSFSSPMGATLHRLVPKRWQLFGNHRCFFSTVGATASDYGQRQNPADDLN